MPHFIQPKNWHEFQHYKERDPIWIKLHRKLLDNYEFHLLPIASKALAPMLWLLASEYDDGQIPGDTRKVAFRVRMTLDELSAAFQPLLSAGFFEIIGSANEDASEPLADRSPVAMPETETQVTSERQKIHKRARGSKLPDDFPTKPDLEAGLAYWRKRGREDLCGIATEITEDFRDHHTAKGTVSESWEASWRTWYRRAIQYNKSEKRNGHGGGSGGQGKGIRGAAERTLEALERAKGSTPGIGEEPPVTGGFSSAKSVLSPEIAARYTATNSEPFGKSGFGAGIAGIDRTGADGPQPDFHQIPIGPIGSSAALCVREALPREQVFPGAQRNSRFG